MLVNFPPVRLPFTVKFPAAHTSNVVAWFKLLATSPQPRFQVNFRKNEDNNADTMLHVNPRPTPNGYKLVLNTTDHAPDAWQQECVYDLGQFSPGVETTLTISMNEKSFTVDLNGVECEFAHRHCNTRDMMKFMHLEGDIEVMGICVADNNQ